MGAWNSWAKMPLEWCVLIPFQRALPQFSLHVQIHALKVDHDDLQVLITSLLIDLHMRECRILIVWLALWMSTYVIGFEKKAQLEQNVNF